MSREILCVAEHRGGRLDPDSLQLLAAAHKLEAAAVAVVCAADAEPVVDQLSGHADKILTFESSELADFTPDGYAQALVPIAQERQPGAILTLHSHFLGRDLAPVLARRLGTGLITDCIELEWQDGLVGHRLVYRRKLVAKQRVNGPSPHVATCQRGAFVPEEPSGAAEVESVPCQIDAGAVRWSVIGFDEAEATAGDITEAEVIVAAGRGIGSQENLAIVEALAKALGGAVAASRPVVDQGWAERGLQVGSSGKTVRPRLYIALGISGAIQHVVGMRDSDVIVAVNKDARAPIFEYADYGIVADLFDIVGPLTEAIRELRGH